MLLFEKEFFYWWNLYFSISISYQEVTIFIQKKMLNIRQIHAWQTERLFVKVYCIFVLLKRLWKELHERLEKFYKEDLRKLFSCNLYDPQLAYMVFHKNRIQARTLHLWKTRPYEITDPMGKLDSKKGWFMILKYVNKYIYFDNTSTVLLLHLYFCSIEKISFKSLSRVVCINADIGPLFLPFFRFLNSLFSY